MKASLYGKSLILVVAILMAQGALGQDCMISATEPASTWGTYSYPGTSLLPSEAFVSTRADLSNPGARALALGGAFIATADDSTSVVANPAGLGATVRPGAQVEVRSKPVVQYDRFGESGVLDPNSPGDFVADSSSVPFFVSGVLPVGDKIVVGAFYQTMFNSSQNVNRVPTRDQTTAGPCFNTVTSRGVATKVLVPLYKLEDKTQIFRTGAAAAFRAAPGLSIGASVYYVSENRDQVIEIGDASSAFYEDSRNPDGTVKVEDSGVGFGAGVQWSPSEAIRVGLVWSSEVAFGNENLKANGQSPINEAFRSTVIPMRAGLGISWAFNPRWSLGLDVVYLGTSKEKDKINYNDPRPPAAAMRPENWKQDDTWEIRAGLEWSVVQTRTTAFSVRFGGWMQTASDLRFVPKNAPEYSDAYFFDALKVIFPEKSDDAFTHATVGFGLVSQKRWQFDVGGDYEFKTKTFVASGLVGYTF